MVRKPPVLCLAALIICMIGSNVSADPVLLALGDSLAFGETDFTHNPSNGDRGYVSLFADHLKAAVYGSRPKVDNLAFDGETTDSFNTGNGNVFGPSMTASLMNTNYGGVAATQNAKMLSAIAAETTAGNSVGYVTLSLGSNDLLHLLGDPSFFGLSAAQQQAMVLTVLGTVQTNLTNLLLELKSQVPNAKIVLVGYYNPYAALVGTPVATIAAPAVQGLNAVLAGEANAFGAYYIDTYTPFLGNEANYTYIMTDFQGVPNVHPNTLGYSVIGAQLNAVPEPGVFVLSCVGLVSLAGSRLIRRKAV